MVEQLNPTLLWHSQAPRKQFEKVQLAEGFWSSWVAPPQDEQIFQVDPSSIMAEKGIATQSKKQAAAIEALLILKQFETYTHHGWSISLDSPLIVNELHIVTSHGGKLMGRGVFPKTRWLFETWPWPLRDAGPYAASVKNSPLPPLRGGQCGEEKTLHLCTSIPPKNRSKHQNVRRTQV